MFRNLFITVPVSMLLMIQGCSLQGQPADAALEVRAEPAATVFFNGEHLGKTPLTERGLNPGAHTVRLVTETQTWTERVELSPGVTTMVSRTFGPTEEESFGEIASFIPGNGIIVTSVPDGAFVLVNGDLIGPAPVSIPGVNAGAHTIRLEKAGYVPRSILGLKVVDGYATRIHMTLPQEEVGKSIALPSDTGTGSAVLSGLADGRLHVTIQPTETGWLRVRSSPGGPVVTQVDVGSTYSLLEAEEAWVKIELDDGRTGWVSRQFVTIE